MLQILYIIIKSFDCTVVAVIWSFLVISCRPMKEHLVGVLPSADFVAPQAKFHSVSLSPSISHGLHSLSNIRTEIVPPQKVWILFFTQGRATTLRKGCNGLPILEFTYNTLKVQYEPKWVYIYSSSPMSCERLWRSAVSGFWFQISSHSCSPIVMDGKFPPAGDIHTWEKTTKPDR